MHTGNGPAVAQTLEIQMKKKALVIGGIVAATALAGGWALAQSSGHGPGGMRGMGPGMHGQMGSMGPGMRGQMGSGMMGMMSPASVATEATASECWDTSYASRYAEVSWAPAAGYGTATAPGCAAAPRPSARVSFSKSRPA